MDGRDWGSFQDGAAWDDLMGEPSVDDTGTSGTDSPANDDMGAYDVGDAFGEHDIEYWIYNGTRLVPASPDETERLREYDAWPRLALWQARERHQMRWAPWREYRRRLTQRAMLITAWLKQAHTRVPWPRRVYLRPGDQQTAAPPPADVPVARPPADLHQ